MSRDRPKDIGQRPLRKPGRQAKRTRDKRTAAETKRLILVLILVYVVPCGEVISTTTPCPVLSIIDVAPIATSALLPR